MVVESSPGKNGGLGIALCLLASSFLPLYVYDSNKSKTPQALRSIPISNL